jgi:hypothetical protein
MRVLVDLDPTDVMFVWCTNRSASSGRAMKPYPRCGLKNLTVPTMPVPAAASAGALFAGVSSARSDLDSQTAGSAGSITVATPICCWS